jgi:uracil permease
VGGMAMAIGKVIITSVACALILGILVNNLLNIKKSEKEKNDEKL